LAIAAARLLLPGSYEAGLLFTTKLFQARFEQFGIAAYLQPTIGVRYGANAASQLSYRAKI